jgi:Flp pilus assembly protein TadB
MMRVTVLVVAAVLLGVGAPMWAAGAVALTAISPILALPAIAGAGAAVVLRSRRERRLRHRPVSATLRSVADEMRAGRTFAQALVAVDEPVADRVVRRLVAAGADASTIARAASGSFERHRATFVAAVSMSEVAGGSLADHLQRMAEVAEIDEAAERERRVSTSQARFSALVVGGVPLIVAAVVVGVRGVPEPGGALMVIPMVVGAGLLLFGSGAVMWMSRTGRRR